MIDLEFKMVSQMQFDVQIQTPTVFLGRFLTFLAGKVTSKSKLRAIEYTANQLLRFMAYKTCYLDYMPALHAAAVSVLTVKLYTCMVAVDLGLARSASQIAKIGKQLKTSAVWDEDCPTAIWTP